MFTTNASGVREHWSCHHFKRVNDFAALIADPANEVGFAALRAAEQTGRPLGTKDFIEGLERVLGRRIARRAPGRKPKDPPEGQQNLL